MGCRAGPMIPVARFGLDGGKNWSIQKSTHPKLDAETSDVGSSGMSGVTTFWGRGQTMGYKRLEFIANRWLDAVNDQGVRVIEPVFDGTEATCRLVCRPIPGSDPPEVEYSCRPSADCERCELITEIAPDGTTIRWCKCVDDGGGLSAARAVKVKGKASAKAKAKRRK